MVEAPAAARVVLVETEVRASAPMTVVMEDQRDLTYVLQLNRMPRIRPVSADYPVMIVETLRLHQDKYLVMLLVSRCPGMLPLQ